jgi:hypothetical protein
MAFGKLGALGRGFGRLGGLGGASTPPVVPGPGGVGSPIGLLLVLTNAS